MSATQRAARLTIVLSALSLAIAATLVYHNSLSAPFVYDDNQHIVQNEALRSLWPIWKPALGTARPVVYLSWALNYAFGELNPTGYHVVNLVIHLLVGLLLFAIIRRTLLRLSKPYACSATSLAFAATLLWIVHPLAMEAVTFVYQRAEALMSLFYLLTLYTVIRGGDSQCPSRWYAASIVCCALGMASKAIMVSAPLMVLLYDSLFLSKSFGEAWQKRRGLYLGLMSTWLLLGWLLLAGSKEFSASAGYSYKSIAPWQYLLTQPKVLFYYLRLALWPHPLVFDYHGWSVAKAWADSVPFAAGVCVLLWLTIRAVRRCQAAGFIGAWFFGILAPTSSIIPIADLLAEHRMYLPLAAPVLFTIVGGHACLRRAAFIDSRSRFACAAAALILAVTMLGSATIRRNALYQSPIALWRDVIDNRPDNPRAHYALGILLGDAGHLEEAVQHFQIAHRLKPTYTESRLNEAIALSRQGKYQGAWVRFEEVIQIVPEMAFVRYAYGLSLAKANRLHDAILQFKRALEINPQHASVHYDLAVALLLAGNRSEAVRHFAQAMILRQDDPSKRDTIAEVVGQAGLTDDVINQIKVLTPENSP